MIWCAWWYGSFQTSSNVLDGALLKWIPCTAPSNSHSRCARPWVMVCLRMVVGLQLHWMCLARVFVRWASEGRGAEVWGWREFLREGGLDLHNRPQILVDASKHFLQRYCSVGLRVTNFYQCKWVTTACWWEKQDFGWKKAENRILCAGRGIDLRNEAQKLATSAQDLL